MQNGSAVAVQENQRPGIAVTQQHFENDLPRVSVFSRQLLEQMAEAKDGGPDKGMEVPEEDTQSAQAGMAAPTTVLCRGKTAEAYDVRSFFSIKIDLKGAIGKFRRMFMENYPQSKSHNFLVSKLASLKMSFSAAMLFTLGVGFDEIEQMKTECRRDAIAQNIELFTENEYAGELLEISGGSKKKLKTERAVIDEYRKQLVSQMKNLGRDDYYTPRKIVECQLEQCSKIISSFREQHEGLEYQMQMASAGIISYDDTDDAPKKALKIKKMIVKGDMRAQILEKKLAGLGRKTSRHEKKDTRLC